MKNIRLCSEKQAPTKLAPQAVNRRRKLPVSEGENSLPRIEYNAQAEIVANYAGQLP